MSDQRGRGLLHEASKAQRRHSAKASDRSRNIIEVLSSLAGRDAAGVSVTVSLSEGTSTAGRGSVMMSPMPCSLM